VRKAVEKEGQLGQAPRTVMDYIALTNVRASTTAEFLHEEPQTPAADDVAAFEEALLADGPDGYPTSIHSPWKRQLFALLERPESTYSAFAIHGELYIIIF
jgi:hypothetical protein